MMTFTTVEGILHPDGRISIPSEMMPRQSTRIMVTMLGDEPDEALAELGDYSKQLEDYEERLARGDINWK